MICRWKHILTSRKLLNGPKALKFTRIDNLSMVGRDKDVLVNRIAKHTVTHGHPHQAVYFSVKKAPHAQNLWKFISQQRNDGWQCLSTGVK